MSQSLEFKAYIKHTAELQRVKLEGMTREETLAFFINIYNALVIHANVVRGPPVNLWQRYKVKYTSGLIGVYLKAVHRMFNTCCEKQEKSVTVANLPY